MLSFVVYCISGLSDLLVVDTPLSLVPRDEADCFRIRRSVFQEEAVLRMLSVFRSATTENSVRMGALRQLATMLDDPALHSAFLGDGGLDSITDKLKELASTEVPVLTEDSKLAVGACVLAMKLLLRRDAVARARLSRDRELLLVLLRTASLCRLSLAALSEVAVVIGLLVFHECLREHSRPSTASEQSGKVGDAKEMSLPATVVARYQVICFTALAYLKVSLRFETMYLLTPILLFFCGLEISLIVKMSCCCRRTLVQLKTTSRMLN